MVCKLLKNIEMLATMDDEGREIANASILITDNVITAVGTTTEIVKYIHDNYIQVDEEIDLTHHVVLPGLVNTHHHMFQSLTRAVPKGQNAELFGWLQTLYPIWRNLKPRMIYNSTLTAMAELIFSGCTTTSDHLYLYPNGSRLDDSIEASHAIGMRFHACRGSMTVGESKGGLPPDNLVETEDAVLKDSVRLIEQFHNANRHAMTRVALAPCSPFSVSQELMKQTALLAREYHVCMHTHLAESDNDVAYSIAKFGMTPAEYAESLGWVGQDVWHAHCVKLDNHGIDLFSRTKTGVAHCPCSNMRLASGIAPIKKMLNAHVPVGLGVDGSASNDCGNLLGEARQAMLLGRVIDAPDALTAREVLRMATRGGADVLDRDDIGIIQAGMSADIIAFRTDTLAMAGGAIHDPVASLVFCTPSNVDLSIINGKVVVKDGHLMTLSLTDIIKNHNQSVVALMN